MPENPEQLSLLSDAEERRRRKALNRTIDRLSDRFGTGVVRRAGQSGVERAGLSFQIKHGADGDEE